MSCPWHLLKWFSANVTIVFFATIMNSFYMLVQISWCVKWIITEITFEIFASLMNSLDMFVQICWDRKFLTTSTTYEFILFFMDCLEVSLQTYYIRAQPYQRRTFHKKHIAGHIQALTRTGLAGCRNRNKTFRYISLSPFQS